VGLAVVVGVGLAGDIGTGAENSDVPHLLVAVAVTFGPVTATGKVQCPVASAIVEP